MKNLELYKEIVVPEMFGQDEDGCCDYLDDFIEDIYETYDAHTASGASKLCIIPRAGEYVIKLPFRGEIYYDESGDACLHHFAYAVTENRWDYCRAELDLYNKAADAGFAIFLAKTKEFGTTKSGHPMYIQEKVNVYGDCRHKYKKDISDNAKSKTATVLEKYRDRYMHNRRNDEMIEEDFIGYTFAETGETFLSYLIDAYSYENVAKFAKWVYENAREIAEDLHWGNIGFRESDGTPCLLDFSGYYD